jgi:hypothetical protein
VLARVISLGLGARPTSQSPSTITGVPVVREAGVITALRLLRGMDVSYGRFFHTRKQRKTTHIPGLHNMAERGTIGPRKFLRLAEKMEGKTIKG